MLAIKTYFRFSLKNASRQGFVAVCPFALMAWKIGVSWSWSRM